MRVKKDYLYQIYIYSVKC